MTEPRDKSLVRARILVSGRVQGVAYRAFTRQEAVRRNLFGGVRNLDDGRVEVEVEGEKESIAALIEVLKKGPPLARVDDLQVTWGAASGRYKDFRIWH
jgi:acylphosphatase